MDRISLVKEYVDGVIQNMKSPEEQKYGMIHTYGVAWCCSLLAQKRGLDREIACISGLLHDIYTYFTGSSMCHGQSGADMARPVIRKMNIFTEEEKQLILSAVFYHSVKDVVHGEYEEVLKDADILQTYFTDITSPVPASALPRLNRVLEELGIKAEPKGYAPSKEKEAQPFNRALLADIAEKLAEQRIRGEKEEPVYLEIIKYYPEAEAFDELKNGWCAAFVYHAALLAGLELPIKQPPYKYRFAGVGPWYEWGKEKGFLYFPNGEFIPMRGDIVIYNNIIPKENKQENSSWHDHIGILLSHKGDYLIVAEGNVDNQNVSGIVKRKYDDTIGCFLRIPDGLEYDGWKCDYKASGIYKL